ncbi:hypothetical protein D3C76_575740 [compost metagenome]
MENTLNDDGSRLSVDITFQSMDDFEPGALARKVEPLAQLLQARTELSNLLSYMDGKSGVEELLAKALENPALLKSLVASSKPETDAE